MDLQVTHTAKDQGGLFSIEQDGTRIGEMTYQRLDDSRVLIDHTLVHEQWRGRGIARHLLDAAVAWARRSGITLEASCSYVLAQFARDASLRNRRD